jgi:hypothetical protein
VRGGGGVRGVAEDVQSMREVFVET